MAQVGWIMYSVVLVLSFTAAASEDECPRSTASVSAIIKLKKQLLCNYDQTLRPVKDHKTPTNVSYDLFVHFFVFDDYTNTMEVHGWSYMTWKDQFLVWNQSEQSGIDQLLLHQRELWVPKIDISTPSKMSAGSSHTHDTYCKVTSAGTVICTLPTVYHAHCTPDVRRWPFDSHNCTMKVCSLFSAGKEINLTYSGMGVVMMKVKSDNYWKYINSTARHIRGNEKYVWPQIVYSFLFERHSSFHVATLFLPAFVMILGTLTTFCLDPHGHARFFITSGNIIAHCLYLLYLSWYLPGNGDTPPAMVIFTRNSFLLVIGSLLITLCTARMKAAARAPPAWICAITDGIIDTPGADYLLFTGLYAQSDSTDEGEATSVETFETLAAATAKLKWERLATLLDRTSFLVFSVTLAILSFTFIP